MGLNVKTVCDMVYIILMKNNIVGAGVTLATTNKYKKVESNLEKCYIILVEILPPSDKGGGKTTFCRRERNEGIQQI